MHRERLVRARRGTTRQRLSGGARGYACPPGTRHTATVPTAGTPVQLESALPLSDPPTATRRTRVAANAPNESSPAIPPLFLSSLLTGTKHSFTGRVLGVGTWLAMAN